MTTEKTTTTTKNLVATPAIAAAVREELRVALQGEPFGIVQLTKIESVARAGKLLLQATQGHLPRGHVGGAINVASSYYPGMGMGMDEGGMVIGNTSGNTSETFGAKALRELGSVLKRVADKGRTRRSVLRELAIARQEDGAYPFCRKA